MYIDGCDMFVRYLEQWNVQDKDERKFETVEGISQYGTCNYTPSLDNPG